jgi:hypothetical protein
MASYIGRREFLATLGGVAAWPLAASARQGERVRFFKKNPAFARHFFSEQLAPGASEHTGDIHRIVTISHRVVLFLHCGHKAPAAHAAQKQPEHD